MQLPPACLSVFIHWHMLMLYITVWQGLTVSFNINLKSKLPLRLCSWLLMPGRAALLHSRNPFHIFQSDSRRKSSGGLKASSLLKYLSHAIDVKTVINLTVAHPSTFPVPSWAHGALWRTCQTSPDEVRVFVYVLLKTFCFYKWWHKRKLCCDHCLSEKKDIE